ncbi:flagellar motor switch protein FliM [Dethiothermospora halolimnae]|uniref:flagellar motor switch protein FliM n=1 Tax=Dethiothermospora halolimnae TaxID=3114390 RepID=UPI003CCBCAF7
MAEVLSQNEIDALLKALNSGEVDVNEIEGESGKKQVKEYDFRNPRKIAKDQLRTLEIIHENLARLLQTFLSGYLRAPVKIEVLTVDQFAYSEFSNAISNPALLPIIDFQPLPGQIIMDFSTKISFVMIDRLLGGSGESLDENRSFTEIELSLLKKMIYKTMDSMAEAWENVIELKPVLDKIEINSQFAQIVSPNETVALITMNISVGDTEGMLNICIPHITIEPVLEKLSTKLWFSNTRESFEEKDNTIIEGRIKKARIPIRAQLGSSLATVKEILQLQKGDVLKLDSGPKNKVTVLVGSNKKFLGIPGRKKNKTAVKITNVRREGEDIYGK